MSDRILVTGAKGLQGGAVARHLLKLGKPEVRCLTRRPDSEAAKAFKQLGADMVKADLDDPASLKLALRGCTGVFGVLERIPMVFMSEQSVRAIIYSKEHDAW